MLSCLRRLRDGLPCTVLCLCKYATGECAFWLSHICFSQGIQFQCSSLYFMHTPQEICQLGENLQWVIFLKQLVLVILSCFVCRALNVYLNVFIIRRFKINNNKNLSKAFNFTVFLFEPVFRTSLLLASIFPPLHFILLAFSELQLLQEDWFHWF